MSMQSAEAENHIEQLRETISRAQHPVAITGAGISVASGLPTVNSSWHGISLKDFFTYQMFVSRTEQFFRIYRSMISDWKGASPNPAHYALAESEFLIITQNIDGLHQLAGSRHVLELHGNLLELVCIQCNGKHKTEMLAASLIPRCPTCSGILKPNIVLLGEEVYHYSTAVDWVGRSDLLLIVGTKLEMAPCRELPKIASRNGVQVFQINKRAEKVLPMLLRKHKKIL